MAVWCTFWGPAAENNGCLACFKYYQKKCHYYLQTDAASKQIIQQNTVKSSNFVRGINFVTPTANFLIHLLGSLHKISKNFKNKLSFKYFSLFMLFHAKKWFIWSFLKIFSLLDFVTKLILKSHRNLPENIKKEAIWKTAIPMKNSSKILNRRNFQKSLLFSG
jgi:hypothetical protein